MIGVKEVRAVSGVLRCLEPRIRGAGKHLFYKPNRLIGAALPALATILLTILLCVGQSREARADFADGQRQFDIGNYQTAIEIWRKSAWQDDDFRSQTELGKIYFDGQYARRDPVESYVWYFMALANQSSFGHSESAREAKYDELDHVVEMMDRIAFSMPTSDQEEARRRIVYILASRGAEGFFNLAEIYHDDDHHDYCQNPYGGGRVDYSKFPRRPTFDPVTKQPIFERGLELWIYCEYGTEFVSFNVFPKNNVEALAYYLLAERFGHPVAAEAVSDYEAYLRLTYGGGPTKSGGSYDVSSSTKMQSKLVESHIWPFEKRKDLVDDVIRAAKRLADVWQPPFERYPGGHSDQSEGRFEHQLALERITELNVSSIQEALRFLGYYRDISDGEIGEQTQKAIAQYQASIGEKITGELTPRQTVRLIQEAADNNHAHSQNVLGTMYYQGIGVPRYYVRARTWFEKAAQQRHPYALMNLAVIYRDGLGVQVDYQKSATYLLEAKSIFEEQVGADNGAVIAKINKELEKVEGLKTAAPDTIATENSTVSVAEIQEALSALGLYDGPIDNEMGPNTRSGIEAYQKVLNAAPTGVLSYAQTDKLFEQAQTHAIAPTPGGLH